MEMSKTTDLGKKSAYDRMEVALKKYKEMYKEKSPEEKYHFLHAELKLSVSL